MRLEQLVVAGFRGFNSRRTIDFHDQLTLISAPNSHGKTSITEALEFLLYGQTSKVESADSKDEYKDSYENRHYSSDEPAFVEAHCADGQQNKVVLRVELDAKGFRRFVDGHPVSEWPFVQEISNSARPFVVQHALKSLLLAAPSDRFQGFARLLGLREVDAIQQLLVNLCTKPEAQIPAEARRLLDDLALFDRRLRASAETLPIAKAISLGFDGVNEGYAKLHVRGVKLVGKNVSEDGLSAALVALRNAAAEKVYSGSVAIKTLSTFEQQRSSAARERIERAIKPEFLEAYARLALGDTADRLRKEVQVLGLGIELLDDGSNKCPFCEQAITEGIRARAKHRHKELLASIGTGLDLSTVRTQMTAVLKDLASNIATHSALQAGRNTDLITANTPESSQKIKALFGKGNEYSLFLVAAAGATIAPSHQKVLTSASEAAVAIEVCTDAIRSKSEDIAQVEALVKAVMNYLVSVDAYSTTIEDVSPTLAEPTRLLQQAVDAHAGTTELSLLIEMLSNRAAIGRAVRIKDTLESLKALKKHVDQAVGQTMEDAFSSDLTGAVMNWYQKIRTTSDPDVHFSGFAMERTKSGDFKNRRVRVTAHSYGVELASAVSSLSESKLNALGLCMSIATALRAPGPWGFLVLDDPIQSWDDDHEIQFIEIIRVLAEQEGKQIILMSHRDGWIDQVVAGCRSINGARYHITGYTKDGPAIQPRDWASLDQRLREALAISKDPTATPVRLQQAEEEIRIAACQLTAEIAQARLRRITGAQSMNSDKARSILTEAGCPPTLTDRVIATFSTTDPAHHASKDYVPNAERVRRYHGTLIELKNWLAS
jgi:AAA domain